MRRRDVHHARRRTIVSGIVPVVLLLTIVTSCSSAPKAKAAAATLVASKTRIEPGDSITLAGAFSTRKAGLDVRLESTVGTATIFTATGDAAATDGSGAYTLNYRPDLPGPVSVRVQVIDGTQKTASTPIRLVVLAATIVSARLIGAAEIGVGTRTSMTGHVTPAVSGRAVGMESSADGAQWTTTPSTTTTDGTGKFKISVPVEPAGPVQLRIVAAATSTQTSGTSTAVRLYTADYKAAGVKYLACVKGSNHEVDAYARAGNAYDSGTIGLADLEKSDVAQALAAADNAQISCLKNYAWPPSVAPWIKDLQGQDAVAADHETQLSHAQTIENYNTIAQGREYSAARAATGADAAKIRQALGLPARTTTTSLPPTTRKAPVPIPNQPAQPPTAQPPIAPAPTVSVPARPTSGPYLAHAYVEPPDNCRHADRYDGHITVVDLWIEYDVVLNVFGPTDSARWYLQNPIQQAAYDTSKQIPGGIQLTFKVIAVIDGPDYQPIHISGELFVYDGGAAEKEVSLTYAAGGLTITKADCRGWARLDALPRRPSSRVPMGSR